MGRRPAEPARRPGPRPRCLRGTSRARVGFQVALASLVSYPAEMAATMRALVIRSSDPELSARFWGDLLGWSRDGLVLVPDADAPFGLRFVESDQPKTGLNQVHFH